MLGIMVYTVQVTKMWLRILESLLKVRTCSNGGAEFQTLISAGPCFSWCSWLIVSSFVFKMRAEPMFYSKSKDLLQVRLHMNKAFINSRTL